jgi:hypothetical protein
MKNIIVFVTFFLFTSCLSNKMYSYLLSCRKGAMLQNTDKQYFVTTLKDLKANLPEHKVIFYVGSSDKFHYFVFYHSSPKISMGFKISSTEYQPKEVIVFKDTNYYYKNYPTLLKNM